MLNAIGSVQLNPYIEVGEGCSIEKQQQYTKQFIENCFKDLETLETISELLHEDVRVFAGGLELNRDEFMKAMRDAYDPNVILQVVEISKGDEENTTVAKVITIESSTTDSVSSPEETVSTFTWKGDKIIQIQGD